MNDINEIGVFNCADEKGAQAFFETVSTHGFAETPLLVDEWGMATAGFFNCEECPALMARESEIFSAYFIKLIHALIASGLRMEMLAICLSGQHEMVTDFSGFRNFFTLNFLRKPIYNAHILASMLGEELTETAYDNENLAILPTKRERGDYAVLLAYASDHFEEDLPSLTEELCFEEDISDKTVTVYCIDKYNNNPYRMWERAGKPEMTEDMLQALREEGKLKPLRVQAGSEPIVLTLNSNATYLVTVTK